MVFLLYVGEKESKYTNAEVTSKYCLDWSPIIENNEHLKAREWSKGEHSCYHYLTGYSAGFLLFNMFCISLCNSLWWRLRGGGRGAWASPLYAHPGPRTVDLTPCFLLSSFALVDTHASHSHGKMERGNKTEERQSPRSIQHLRLWNADVDGGDRTDGEGLK